MELPLSMQEAVAAFHRLPVIGERSATRHVLYMAHWSEQELGQFAESLNQLAKLRRCIECGMYSDEDKCSICVLPQRANAKSLCVVENMSDCLAIERSGHFSGPYHVLGGVLNPLRGIGPTEIGIDRLMERIKRKEMTEVILALNPSVEGDATCSYIKDQLPEGVEIERIGFGIPMGGSLEYLDSLTIAKALENRTIL